MGLRVLLLRCCCRSAFLSLVTTSYAALLFVLLQENSGEGEECRAALCRVGCVSFVAVFAQFGFSAQGSGLSKRNRIRCCILRFP